MLVVFLPLVQTHPQTLQHLLHGAWRFASGIAKQIVGLLALRFVDDDSVGGDGRRVQYELHGGDVGRLHAATLQCYDKAHLVEAVLLQGLRDFKSCRLALLHITEAGSVHVRVGLVSGLVYVKLPGQTAAIGYPSLENAQAHQHVEDSALADSGVPDEQEMRRHLSRHGL